MKTFEGAPGRLALAGLTGVLVVACRSAPAEVGDPPAAGQGEAWTWTLDPQADPSTVRVLLGDEPGVRGTHWEIDEETLVLRFLRAEDRDPAREYFVVYDLRADPEHPERATAISFGNHTDRGAVRSFLGLPRGEPAGAAPAATFGTNAVPTGVPGEYRVSIPLEPDGLRVAVASNSEPARLRWLEPGAQWSFDADLGLVQLAAGVAAPGEDEYLLVSGRRSARNVLRLPAPLDPDDVVVILGDRRLEPGTDFVVDGAAGTIAIRARDWGAPGAQYFVRAGNLAVGNYRDGARLAELLER